MAARQKYEAMAVAAGNGGLIPRQSVMATPVGRFQFVLGRELWTVVLWPDGRRPGACRGAGTGDAARIVRYKSVLFDLPILEYRPYRSFAGNQSSTVLFPLLASADVPYSESVVSPAVAPDADLRTVWSVGVRLVFDWRYYP